MLLFLPLVFLVFCGPTNSAGSVCFCPFLLCSLCPLTDNMQYLSALLLIALRLTLFAFFLAGLLSYLLALRFLAVCHPWQISSPGPLWALQCLFRVPPPCYIGPLRLSSPSMCIYAPPILCVCLLLVCICVFWQYAHIVRSCTYVFPDTHSASMCALGVLCVSRDPWPKLEPRYRLFCMICKLK